jgi:hypothetical protein
MPDQQPALVLVALLYPSILLRWGQRGHMHRLDLPQGCGSDHAIAVEAEHFLRLCSHALLILNGKHGGLDGHNLDIWLFTVRCTQAVQAVSEIAPATAHPQPSHRGAFTSLALWQHPPGWPGRLRCAGIGYSADLLVRLPESVQTQTLR